MCSVFFLLFSLGAIGVSDRFLGSYKLFGTGPGRIKPEMIAKYYRYNSGSKCFVELKGAKHTTSTTCGVQLLPGCYQRGKGGGGGGMPLFMRGGE